MIISYVTAEQCMLAFDFVTTVCILWHIGRIIWLRSVLGPCSKQYRTYKQIPHFIAISNSSDLTLKASITTAADDNVDFFFPENIMAFHVNCLSKRWFTLNVKTYFLWKIKATTYFWISGQLKSLLGAWRINRHFTLKFLIVTNEVCCYTSAVVLLFLEAGILVTMAF